MVYVQIHTVANWESAGLLCCTPHMYPTPMNAKWMETLMHSCNTKKVTVSTQKAATESSLYMRQHIRACTHIAVQDFGREFPPHG